MECGNDYMMFCENEISLCVCVCVCVCVCGCDLVERLIVQFKILLLQL
jgi:hypothetical protein